MAGRIAAPDEGEWGWHRAMPLLPLESATSWIGRFARSKTAASTMAFCQDHGLPWDNVRLGRPEALAKIAAWGGLDAGRLSHQACRRVSEVELACLGFVFAEGMLDLSHARICPACLREDARPDGPGMYGRLPWMLRSFRICPHHGLAIQTLPLGTEIRAPQDFIGHLKPMREKVLAGDLDKPVTAIPVLEAYLLARLSGTASNHWLDSFSPEAVMRFSEVLGIALHLGTDSRLSELSDAVLHEAVPYGFAAMADGPTGVTAAFAELRNRPGSPHDGPQARYGILHHWFAGPRGRHPACARLRALFREHILDHWPQQVGARLFGETVVTSRVHTVASAARHWRVPARQLRKALAARGLVSPSGDPALDLVEVFRTDAARDILEALSGSLSRPMTARRLGVTENQLGIIEEAGILPALRLGPDVKPRHASEPVAALQARIEARITGTVEAEAAEWEGLRQVVMRCKSTLPEVLNLILDGHVEVRRIPSEKVGIAGLRLRAVDVLAILGGEPEARRLSRRAVSDRLNAGETVIDWLVAEGHLSCEDTFVPGTRLRKFSFDPDEVEVFHQTYASLSRLSREWNLSRPEILRLLVASGIEPAIRNASGKVRFYQRHQIEPIRPS